MAASIVESTMTSEMTPKCFDLVLSSGFLAFARQVGFLGAIEEVPAESDPADSE